MNLKLANLEKISRSRATARHVGGVRSLQSVELVHCQQTRKDNNCEGERDDARLKSNREKLNKKNIAKLQIQKFYKFTYIS